MEKIQKNKLIHLLLLISLLITSSLTYAQTFNIINPQSQNPNQPKIQSSQICTKTIINNTSLPAVEVITHRIIPSFGSTIIQTNCQTLRVKQSLGSFFITKAGHSVSYIYNPNGTVVVRFSGRISNPTAISCTGCPGGSGLTSSFGAVRRTNAPIPAFSDCDAAGTCLCFPCPVIPKTGTSFPPRSVPALQIVPITNTRP